MTDASTTQITVADIQALAAERTRIRTALTTIGREIHAIRHGDELNSGFRLSDYMLTDFDGTHYAGMDEEEWEIGTPLVALAFYNSSWQDARCITFPQAWLTEDWKKLETERVNAIRNAAQERAEADRKIAEAARELAERQHYDRLKRKYEGASQ